MNGLYIGSFNPFHLGHEYVARLASRLCTELYVCTGVNPEKTEMHNHPLRMSWITTCLQDLPNVRVGTAVGLTADYCVQHNIDVIFKGVRNSTDFENERLQALTNSLITSTVSKVDTVFIPSPSEYETISSSLIRTLVQHGYPISGLVNPKIESEVVEYFEREFEDRLHLPSVDRISNSKHLVNPPTH